MADDAFRDVRSPDHLNETAPLHGNDSADPTVVSAVPQHPTAPRDERLSAASDACRHVREDLAALRAYVHSATAEQSKWIMKMNRVVKKVVPALSNAMVTNGPMPEDALRWLHGVADHAAGRPGSSSIHSSVVGGRSPCPASVTGSPTEVAMEQTVAIAADGLSHPATADHEDCTDTSATHQVLHTIVPGGGNTADRSGGLVSKRGSVFLDSESSPVQLDAVLVPKGSSSSLRQHVQGSAPSGAASADGSMSQYPGSSISHLEGIAPAPSGERELLTTQDTLGAPLTTTTGGLVAAAPPSSPPQLLGSHGRSLKSGAHARNVAAALAALDEHASYHADQHHQRSGRDASTLSQRVQGIRCRVPALPQVVPSGGPVLTMSCYGAPSNEHTYDATGNSPRAPLPVHPWSIGTSTRHGQLLIEAQLAAALHLSTAQLRAISPWRLEALLQDLSGHSHNAATHPHNAAHALRPLSDAAVVGASLSAMGLASSVDQRLPSPTKDASVSAGLRTDSGGMQTVTPLTSLYHLAHQATPYNSQQAFPVPIGVPLLRTSGPSTFGTSPRVITAATSPPAPPLATTTAVAAAMTAPAPAPPSRATVSAQSARIKKGLVMTSNLRTTGGVHVTPPAGIRGGVVNSARPAEAPSKSAVVPAAATTGVGRNHSSLGLTAWTPPMPHIVGSPK